jgi:hypothetical protein
MPFQKNHKLSPQIKLNIAQKEDIKTLLLCDTPVKQIAHIYNIDDSYVRRMRLALKQENQNETSR